MNRQRVTRATKKKFDDEKIAVLIKIRCKRQSKKKSGDSEFIGDVVSDKNARCSFEKVTTRRKDDGHIVEKCWPGENARYR